MTVSLTSILITRQSKYVSSAISSRITRAPCWSLQRTFLINRDASGGCVKFSSSRQSSPHDGINSYFSKILKTLPQHKSNRNFSQRQYEIDSNVPKNILIYSSDNGRFYKLLSFFGAAQFFCWGYLSYFAFTRFEDEEKKSVDDSSWLSVINAGQIKYKNGLSFLFLGIGYLILSISILYPLRAIRQLWLLKGGNKVGVSTYGTFGKHRNFIVPVEEINCLRARTDSGTQIPMKLKGRWFFFLLDKKGAFHNTKLFDYSVGLHRQLK